MGDTSTTTYHTPIHTTLYCPIFAHETQPIGSMITATPRASVLLLLLLSSTVIHNTYSFSTIGRFGSTEHVSNSYYPPKQHITNNNKCCRNSNIQRYANSPLLLASSSSLSKSPNKTRLCMTGSAAAVELAEESDEEDSMESSTSEDLTKSNNNILKRTWSRIFPPKQDSDGLTVRQRLTKMGMSVLLSYGFVSNMSYCVSVSLAWYGFTKKTGLSPLAPGQWPKFLAVYAGFYIFNNIIRPLRITLSVYVASYFDNIVKSVQKRLNCSKGVAVGAVVFLFNVCGTLTLMSAGITFASILSGVPIWAK